MPSLSILVPHSLGIEEASARLKTLLGKIKEKYAGQISNLEENWGDNAGDFSFSVMGFKTTGKINVEASQVTIDAHLPLTAALFKGRIEEAIREQVTKELA
jgi:hypothetical protein